MWKCDLTGAQTGEGFGGGLKCRPCNGKLKIFVCFAVKKKSARRHIELGYMNRYLRQNVHCAKLFRTGVYAENVDSPDECGVSKRTIRDWDGGAVLWLHSRCPDLPQQELHWCKLTEAALPPGAPATRVNVGHAYFLL